MATEGDSDAMLSSVAEPAYEPLLGKDGSVCMCECDRCGYVHVMPLHGPRSYQLPRVAAEAVEKLARKATK